MGSPESISTKNTAKGAVMKKSRNLIWGICTLCRRETQRTFHHLIPKKVHRRTYFRQSFSREHLQQGIYICRICHDGIHYLYDEIEIARNLSTPQDLKRDRALQKHFRWASKQKT